MRLAGQWVPLLLCGWAGSAGAAGDCSGTLAINSPADVTTLNQCKTFNGNVSVTGWGIEDITLNGLKTITGTLEVVEAKAILSISSTTLESVSTIVLNELPMLITLALPALTNFSKLDFTGLTALKDCKIATGTLQHDVNEISIVNTALETMDWIRWPVARSLNLAANMKLVSFKLPFDKISIGSSYQISINSALENLDFSELTAIYGSLSINGNKDTQMNFDKLETIDGYVRLSGPFTNMTMPALTEIKGALRAESTVNIINFCNWLSTQSRLIGHYDCTANNTSPVTSSTDSKTSGSTTGTLSVADGQGSNNKKLSLSTGAIVGITVAMVVVISLVLSASALFLFRRRRSQMKAQTAAARLVDRKTRSTSTLGVHIDTSGSRYEIGGGKTTHEMSGSDAVRELDGSSLQELDGEKPFLKNQKSAPDSPIGRFELP